MATATLERYITAEEAREEWRRTCRLPKVERWPAREALGRRVVQRDDALFERYGRPYLETHPDKWIAIDERGEVILTNTKLEASTRAQELFEPGSYTIRRLNEDEPGVAMGL